MVLEFVLEKRRIVICNAIDLIWQARQVGIARNVRLVIAILEQAICVITGCATKRGLCCKISRFSDCPFWGGDIPIASP